MTARFTSVVRLCLVLTTGMSASLAAGEGGVTGTPSGWKQHDTKRPKPRAVEPMDPVAAGRPPRAAVVLFDGSNLDAWQTPEGQPAGWKVTDGEMVIAPGAGEIQTRGRFGDVQLHIEWAAPAPPQGTGQDRGNSGVFLMGACTSCKSSIRTAPTPIPTARRAAIYGQHPPIFNASRPPGHWQTYDVAFRRPRFDSGGSLLEPRITVFHNGILVQNNEEILGQTHWLRWIPYARHGRRRSSCRTTAIPCAFRNIWLVDLPERPAPHAVARPAGPIRYPPQRSSRSWAGTPPSPMPTPPDS